jgi:hypothetical protein
MVSQHNFSFAERLFAGAARFARYNKNGLPPKGLPVDLPIYHNFGAVAAADRDGLVQSVNPADGATLTLRSTVTGMTNTGGVVTLDTARNVIVYMTADESTKTLTITGTDINGEAMVETIAGIDGTGTVKIAVGNKCFKTISSIIATGNFGTIEVGFGYKLGLPFRVDKANKIIPLINGKVAAPYSVQATITAIGTAQNTTLLTPLGGKISKAVGVSAAANGTSSSTVTITNAAALQGSTTVGTIVFSSSYSANTAQNAAATLIGTAVAANGVIRLDTDGTGDGAGQAVINLEIDPCTVTIADDTAATATTGDIRGSVDFGAAPDGSLEFSILMISPTRTTKELAHGVTQYSV